MNVMRSAAAIVWLPNRGPQKFQNSHQLPHRHRITAAAAMPPKVALVTTSGCAFCRRAMAALAEAGVDYQEIDVSERLAVLEAVKRATGQATVPLVFVGGELVGGAAVLLPMLQDGSFQRMVGAAAAQPLPAAVQTALSSSDASPSGELAQLSATAGALVQLAAELGAALGSDGCALREAAAWLEQNKPSADSAVDLLGRMQAAQLVTLLDAPPSGSGGDVPITPALLAASPTTRVGLVAHLPLAAAIDAPLNAHFAWFGPARPAPAVAQSIRQLALTLYDAHMTADGRKVNYRGMAADAGFRRFVAAAAELQRVDVAALTREQALCFWINTYNSLVVHAIAVAGAAEGTLGRLRWFGAVSYLIGGRRYSLNDIEHGVLRGNAPNPASLLSLLGRPQWAGRTFGGGDPRARLAITPLDPRIHFALNCGALSCPPIRVYTPERLEAGLAGAAQAFCAGEVEVDVAAVRVTLSMIMKWYAADFGPTPEMLRFLAQYVPDGTRADLEAVLQRGGPDAEGVQLEYRPYCWEVNAAKE